MKRPRVLRNLRIDEVSSVDKGAGDGVKITLMKRDAAGDALRASLLKQQARDRLDAVNDEALDAINDDGDSSNMSRHISHLADLICEAKPDVSRQEALDWLLHTKSGQALIVRTKKRKEQTMPEIFSKMVADIGIERIAKAVVERGYSTAISEREFTEAVTALAVKRFPDKPRDVAFAKLFGEQTEEAATLRKAHAIIKGMPRMTLVPVGDESVDDGGNAYDALMAKAAELRQADGSLTEAQAFAKVYTDPANARLAQKERLQNRPRAGQ
jgi:hypothetical protein